MIVWGDKMNEIDEYYIIKEVMNDGSKDIKDKILLIKALLLENERKSIIKDLDKLEKKLKQYLGVK